MPAGLAEQLPGESIGEVSTCSASPTYVVVPTYSCNMRCAYCYEGSLTKSNEAWTADMRDRLVRAIEDLHRAHYPGGAASLVFLGGEVGRPEFSAAVCEVASELARRIEVSQTELVTNGSLLTGCLPDLLDAGFSSFQITLDGPRDEHDRRRKGPGVERSFESIIGAMRAITDAGRAITVRVNLDIHNVAHLNDLLVFLDEEFGVDARAPRIDVYPLSSWGKAKWTETELAQAFFELVDPKYWLRVNLGFHGASLVRQAVLGQGVKRRNYYCGLESDQYVFNFDGQAYGCWFGSTKEQMRLGDLSLGPQLFERKQKFRNRQVAMMEPCNTCAFALVCGGGCSFKSASTLGDWSKGSCADFEGLLPLLMEKLYHASCQAG